MMARIDRLSPVDRRVLRCAAVVGASFQRSSSKRRSRRTSVTRTCGAGWRSSSSRRTTHLRFRHALVRDAAYEGLPYRRRREVHERVGETIERAADDTRGRGGAAFTALLPRPRVRQGVAVLAHCRRARAGDLRERRGCRVLRACARCRPPSPRHFDRRARDGAGRRSATSACGWASSRRRAWPTARL